MGSVSKGIPSESLTESAIEDVFQARERRDPLYRVLKGLGGFCVNSWGIKMREEEC